MPSVKNVCLLLSILILPTCAASAVSHSAWTPLEDPAPRHLVTWAAGDSESAEPVFESFADTNRFQFAWMEIVVALGSSRFPSEQLRPTVDFSNCVGFAYAGGKTWNTFGYAVRNVERVDGAWHVRLDPITAQTKGPGVATKPYGVCLLTRVPGATIVVDENVQDRMDAPPEWKERGRFTVPRDPSTAR